MAQYVFERYQTQNKQESNQANDLMKDICVDFELIYKGKRCTFKNGMPSAVAEYVCKQLKPLIYSDIQGVSTRTCWNARFFYINNAVYAMFDDDNVCYLQQYSYKRGQQIVPLLTNSTILCFQVYLDVSDIEDAGNSANPTSNITVMQQYQRAQILVDYCYHLVMDETANTEGCPSGMMPSCSVTKLSTQKAVPQPNIEVVDNLMQVCSLQYQSLWDIIVGYAYSDNVEEEILQQAEILAKVVTLDRQYTTEDCKDKFTDFFQKAINARKLQAACVHVVKECRKRISGFFLNLRSAGLPLSCAICGQGRKLDHSEQLVQMYSLDLNPTFINEFTEDVEEITNVIARTQDGTVDITIDE